MGKARDYIPALKFGHKIYPEDLAGMLGIPHVGNVWYVDGTGGSDTTNSGTTQDDALATVYAAEEKCVSGQHDVVIIAPTGGTGRTSETKSIVWDKRFTHLIGSTAPVGVDNRAGMSFSSAATTPSLTISNNGCIFKNLTIAQFNDVNVMVSLTGNQNYFENVHFAGIGNATAGADTAARCVELEGAEENLFQSCVFGLDTVARSAANASVSQGGVSPRNVYRDCDFNLFTSSADAFHFMVENNDAVQRYVKFIGCRFHNPDTASSTTLTANMNMFGVGLNGTVYLIDCWSKGATDWADSFTHLFLNMPLADTDEGGLMKIAT